MAQRGQLQVNTFTKGLITEANPLSFPTDAALDIINMHLKRNGTMERRLGMDFEENYALNATGLSSDVLAGARVTAYRWTIPNGNIEKDIGVIQIGNQIWFLDLFTTNPSANLLNGGSPVVATGISNSVIMTFTTLNNYLIGVANQLPQPYLFTYDADTDTVTTETAAIVVRDLWGVDDSLEVNGRPASLSSAHHYNLLNQGWTTDVQSTCGAGISAIDCTFNTFGIYPSNSDQWSLGRIEDLTSADVKKFDPNVAARSLVSTGQSPRGHFIIDLYNRGASRSTQTGLTLPLDRETGRITAIAAYAGRVFYGGILSRVAGGDNRSPSLSGTVLFSQLFENKINLVKCYQEADPTSPDINDIVDTDGGLIQIPECSYIYALRPTKESLFVFAANGVWEIRGDEGGFRATSFQINRISNVGVYAPKSIVEVNNSFFFWGDSGIYTLTKNDAGFWNTDNITLNTIQRFYNSLPDPSKKNARGYHDLHTNTARWLYYSSYSHDIGDPIDQPIVDIEPVTTVGVPTDASVTGIDPRVLGVARLSNTRYVVVISNGTSGAIQYINTEIDPITLTIVSTYLGTLVAAPTATVIRLEAVPSRSDRFLLVTSSTSLGIEARLVTVNVDNSCTASAPTVLYPIPLTGITLSDVIDIDEDRAIVYVHRSSPSKPDILVLDYSTGSIVAGATFTRASTYGTGGKLKLIFAGTTSRVLSYTETEARILYIDASNVVTESASSLNLSTYTFTGGGVYLSSIIDGMILVGNRSQLATITVTDPPALVGWYNGTGSSFGEAFTSTSLEGMVKVPSASNKVYRVIHNAASALSETFQFHFVSVNASTTSMEEVSPRVTLFDPALDVNRTVEWLSPFELDSTESLIVVVSIVTNPRRVFHQILRVV